MKISLCVNDHQNNKIFSLDDINANRDNCLYPFHMLKKRLALHNIDISTSDILPPKNADIAFYFDFDSDKCGFSKLNYLFLFESKIIKPLGWLTNVQRKFDKIFTWDDKLVDNKKFFKINFTQLFPTQKELIEIHKPFSERKLCVLIAGNKLVKHPDELYSERVRIIKWFEKKHLNSFDLYGRGWNNKVTHNRYLNFFLRKFSFLNLLFEPYRSYKGEVKNKIDVLRNYRFSICFENAKNQYGYITEKIFDCLFSSTIPVYWGAENILDHIPKECFIDYRDFSCDEDLFKYMNEMSESEYDEYLTNISSYLLSDKSNQFKEAFLSEVIIRHVLDDIKKD
ncbi:glycosyltransferase family 10 [Yersinia enterocolitica]|uniref:glycosyltransferase family 10 domain-containing protein n=1 Tax=Yersinia enterocolitica TaxID=630 RepID=UPI0029320309|nr:hypothetical protein [Yersinia enterocolitica]HEC1640655.1 hypothetical protein [Yersinia enterocolitica]HEN3296762.1 hypothetical protein [Yersinia enterocolitica]